MAKRPTCATQLDAAQRAFAASVLRADRREMQLQQKRITRLAKACIKERERDDAKS
jgi:hypothetical protein